MSFPYCNRLKPLVVLFCKRKKAVLWQGLLGSPTSRGSFSLSRDDCICQYARAHFLVNFSKALSERAAVHSNAQYLQDIFDRSQSTGQHSTLAPSAQSKISLNFTDNTQKK